MSVLVKTLVFILLLNYCLSYENCTFNGWSNGAIVTSIDLSSLKGEIITGHTSGYTYSYSPCQNGIACHKSNPQEGMFTATNKSGFCETMGTYDYTIDANFHESTRTFQFITNNGANGELCNGIQRLYWICNESVPTYNVIYAGAECVCCWGMNIESKLACNPYTSTTSKPVRKDDSLTSCNSAYDCSYNGQCIDGTCKCKPQWKGQYCAQLNILATDKSWGYQGYNKQTNQRISSWGGSVVGPDKNGLYHMYAAQLDGGGIFVWRANSILIHAVTNGTNGIGKYEYVSTVKGVWSHEPSASIASTGEYVIYVTNSPTPNGGNSQISPCKGVYNGMTKDCDQQQIQLGDYTPTVMLYSKNPDGPWSDIKNIPTANPDGYDACLSSFFYPNGSFIAMFEGNNGFYVEYSDNWKDNSSYSYHHVTIPTGGGEDPFLWVDGEDNVVHAIFHGGGWDSPFGYHAFSLDNGRTWNGFSHDIHAYDSFTEYTDGTNTTFARLERPHLVMAQDGYTPVALTNSAQPGGESLDYSYTLLRPINQN